MKLATMTSKKAMHRSTMSMGNFLLTDYKVHNVSYRPKYVLPDPVFKPLSMNFVEEKKRSAYLLKVIFLSDFFKALPPQFFFQIFGLIQRYCFAADRGWDKIVINMFFIKQASKRRLNRDCSKWCIAVLCALIFLVLLFGLVFILYFEVWDQSLCTGTDYTPCSPGFCVYGECKQRDGLAFCDCARGYTGRKCDLNETAPCNQSSHFVCRMSRYESDHWELYLQQKIFKCN